VNRVPHAPDSSLRSIAIVGAGFGGLAVAIELKRAGIDTFTVFERGTAVGGVWRANTYPGAACDVPSEIYSFSYALKPDWARRFGSQAEIQRYLEQIAADFDLDSHLRLGTEVTALKWREDATRWSVELGDGQAQEFDVVVCATGQLSRPKIPELPGRDQFRGAQFHSAEWDHDFDITDRRVAVVGSGASAVQIVPAIADAAAHLTVIQRSPNWVVPKYDWSTSVLERTLNRVPAVARLRHNFMWWWFEKNYPIVLRSADPSRKLFEAKARWLIRRHLRDRVLARAVTPTYPMGCNRILLSSQWYPTLARDDVTVVAAGVERLTDDALLTADGRRVEADVIVWCTGFTPTEYLAPMRITGRQGADIRERWRDGPEAYLGMTAPGFPNLFMSYGPNTGSLTNTIIFMLERQAAYIRQAVEYLADGGVGSLDIDPEIHRAYNEKLQRRLGRTVFTAGCPGWYTTDDGKVTTVFPGSHVEYARLTRKFDAMVFQHGLAARTDEQLAPAVAVS
jgi:cation diffusion facilitator CzcD-associated flavoprotein CzcO